jgi:hypothetical protein
MAVGLIIRLAIIPFLYHEWLDPFVLEHWAFGRVARSLVTGHGYGNTFADTGASALMPPVYTYCLAALFRIFGVYTTAAIFAAAALNSIISVLTCIPVFFIALRSFGARTARWSAWAWALSPYGIYFSADWLWSTALVTLLLALLFQISIRLENDPRLRPWLGFGVLAGIAALTEPVVLAVVPIAGRALLLPSASNPPGMSSLRWPWQQPCLPGSSATTSSSTNSSRCAMASDWSFISATAATASTGRTAPSTPITATRSLQRIREIGRDRLHGAQAAAGRRLHRSPQNLVRLDDAPPHRLYVDRLLELR